jgi:ubiquinone/menaquinone biosynthesis C-methylase UbiE
VIFMLESRRRQACLLMSQAGVFPQKHHHVCEIGFGYLGWLADFLGWGIPQNHLHGIELKPSKAAHAKARFPLSDLRAGDASQLPWPDQEFDLVVLSTMMTSVLDTAAREKIAKEVVRVLRPGGAVLWYDMRFNNPSNPIFRRVKRRELQKLFPRLHGKIKSVTLAPPISRFVAGWSWPLATFLESVPLLRTHLIAVLLKEEDPES